METEAGRGATFLWGAATSAHQIEGHNHQSDWWEWEAQGHASGGVSSGAATDHWNRRDEDLGLAASLGLNAYRFSLEWAKVEPEPGRWSEEAFAWYSSLLDRCEELGLVPMLTLHHFTLPRWVAERGGFSNEATVELFGRFCREVIRRLGSRVPLWCTVNEPMVLALGSYLGGFMPPAIQEPHLVSRASVNLFEAHCFAYRAIHDGIAERSGPWRDRPVEVGIAHNMLDFLPDRWWHPLERSLTFVVDRFYNRAWLKAVAGRGQHFGVPGLIPVARPKTPIRKATADFLGVNYYTKAYLRWRPRDASEGSLRGFPVGIAFARRNEEQTDVGWALHPEGFRKALRKAAAFGLPIYVTENGVADRADQYRSRYLLSHLRVVADIIAGGIDIRGYFHWSLLDNFEWKEGFGPRFGLVEIDYSTFQRRVRSSALLYRNIIREHAGRVPDAELLAHHAGEVFK